jgi:hypothetical protein
MLCCGRSVSAALRQVIGLWVLSLFASGGIRIQSLWRVGLPDHQHRYNYGLALVCTEIAAVSVCFLFVVAQTLTLAPFYCWAANSDVSSTTNDDELMVSEDEASSVASIFFVWLSPFLRLGQRVPIESRHLSSVQCSWGDDVLGGKEICGNKHLLQIGRLFYREAGEVVIFSVLLACVQLCQPLIIQALVEYLNQNQAQSVGQ